MVHRSLFTRLAVFAVLTPAGSAAAQVAMPVSYENVLAQPRRAPDLELRYGDEPSQFVRLWRPSGSGAAPVVVLLHGGCWSAAYGVDHVEPLATALAAEGWAVWAPEYRRVGEAGGGWPGTFEDVAAAIDLLQSRADPDLDVRRTIYVGHSAGGHLALWAAARSAFEPSHPQRRTSALVPRGVVGLAAVTDLVAYGAMNGGCPSALTGLLGGRPNTQPERYAWASPAALPHPVRTVLIQGTRDPIVPASQARALSWASTRMIEGAEHFDVIHPGTVVFAALVEELRGL